MQNSYRIVIGGNAAQPFVMLSFVSENHLTTYSATQVSASVYY